MKKKVGIIAPGAAGDLLLTTAMLPHKDTLWPDSDIIWYAKPCHADLLAHNPYVSEVRSFDAIGECRDVRQEGDEFTHGTRVDMEKARKVPVLADLDVAYFSTPWLVSGVYWGFSYVDLVKHIFGLSTNLRPWHPILEWTPEEEKRADDFVKSLLPQPCVMLETVCKSGQSRWSPDTTQLVMQKCIAAFGPCNFLLASREEVAERWSAYLSASTVSVLDAWTIRQLVPLFNRCVFFGGCASGITCATTCWRASDKVVRFVYHNHPQFSTNGVARGSNLEATKECDLNNVFDDALKLAVQYLSSRQA